MKKITSIVLSVCLILSAVTFGIVFSSADSGTIPEQYKGQGKTLTELSSKWNAVKALEVPDEFTTPPNYTTAPYAAGALKSASQDYATAYLNFARYLAGVPAVSWNANGAKLAQAASVVNKLNGSLSHGPSRPANISDALFEDGYVGSAKTNISFGRSTLHATIGQGWLNDSDASNIASLGHRANFLSPTLPFAGFGRADNFYAGMALGGENVNPNDGRGKPYGLTNNFMWDLNDYRGTVMYPAPGYFPIQALPNAAHGAAWSIQFDRTYSMNNSNFVVTVNNKTKNEITTLTESDTNKDGKYLSKPHKDLASITNSANSSLGMISFRTSNALLVVGDEYTITVSGIKDRNGVAMANITYDVKIIDMDNLPKEEESSEPSQPEPPLEPEFKGDVDADGTVSVADALLALRIITGDASVSEKQLWAADVGTTDGATPTSADVLLILKKALGIIHKFPTVGN